MQSVTRFVRCALVILAPILAIRARSADGSVSISGSIYDVISSAEDGRLMVTVVRGRTQYLCIIPGIDREATKVWNSLDIDQPISFAGVVVSAMDQQRLLGRYLSTAHEGNFRNIVLHPCRIATQVPSKQSPLAPAGGAPTSKKPNPANKGP